MKTIILIWFFLNLNLFGTEFVIDDLSNTDLKLIISKCVPNDTIRILKGYTKTAGIFINIPLTIIGQNHPVIEGNNKDHILKIRSDSVTIKGLLLKNSGKSYVQDRTAIRIDSSDYCRIENNIIDNCMFGIYSTASGYLDVSNNQFSGNAKSESGSGNGIHLWYCTDVTLHKNTITKHRDGIYLEFVKQISITDNFSHGNARYGLHFMFSHKAEYLRNKFSNNGSGVAVMYTKEVLMKDNIFEKSVGSSSYGLLLKEISDSKILNNKFESNTTGIYIEGGGRNLIKNNILRKNAWALRIYSSSSGNTFTRNMLIGNSFDVTTNSTFNPNEFVENYWDKYNGYDVNRDGIGDVPYHPVRLFAYLVEKDPPLIILLHSFFVYVLEIAENLMPSIVPDSIIDSAPLMKADYDKV
ncbi:MAG: nitrous oxide reductase family maturation protein NosD [Candidatus Kapabacteria bacterium]|nr:nitrous oxide reductase family maturation protein NosD [Candidatus Kapabacteria bacterium]